MVRIDSIDLTQSTVVKDDSIVDLPTKEGEFLISRQDLVNGGYKYYAGDLIIPDLSDVKQGDAFVANQALDGLVSARILTSNDATDSVINQAGVITEPSLSISGGATIFISGFRAAFVNAGSASGGDVNVVEFKDITLTIDAVQSSSNNSDTTWIEAKSDGTFAQQNTKPSLGDLYARIFVAEVVHVGGAKLDYVAPRYISHGDIARVLSDSVLSQGIQAKNFLMSYIGTSGSIQQSSQSAKLVGYNINTSPSTDSPNKVDFSANSIIRFDYYSYNKINRVEGIGSLSGSSYAIDVPASNTSVAMTGFGILLLFADVTGRYTVLSAQKDFATTEEAEKELYNYIAEAIVPDFLRDLSVIVASMIVPPSVYGPGDVVILENIGAVQLRGSSVPKSHGSAGGSLPSGNEGDLLSVRNGAYVFEEPTVNVPQGTTGSKYLVASEGKIKLEELPDSLKSFDTRGAVLRRGMILLLWGVTNTTGTLGFTGDTSEDISSVTYYYALGGSTPESIILIASDNATRIIWVNQPSVHVDGSPFGIALSTYHHNAMGLSSSVFSVIPTRTPVYITCEYYLVDPDLGSG